MLCVVPLLRALRSHYPRAYIALIASPVNCDVMMNNTFLDDVLLFDKREFLSLRGIPALVRYVRRLREKKFGLALVPSTVSTSFTSDLLAYLSGAPVRIGVGKFDALANPSSFCFTHPVHLRWDQDPHRHQTLRNLDLVSSLGIECNDLAMEITLRPEEIAEGKTFVTGRRSGSSSAVCLHPGAGKTPNRWNVGAFAQVADRLTAESGARIFVTSGPMDKEVILELARSLHVPYELIENQPIRRVASILCQMDLLITNDTGIMHVGAASGAPVLSLFGPTDPLQWAPVGLKNRYIRGADGTIDSISVEQVLNEAKEMLGSLHRGTRESVRS